MMADPMAVWSSFLASPAAPKTAMSPLELDGYLTGFTINAVIMVASGLLGLALLWPNTERARLMGEVPQPKFA